MRPNDRSIYRYNLLETGSVSRSAPLNNEDRDRARNYRHFERAKLPSPAINQLADSPTTWPTFIVYRS